MDIEEKYTPDLVSTLHEYREQAAPLLVGEGLLRELVRCDGRRATIPITCGHRWIVWRVLNDTRSKTKARALIMKWLQPLIDEGLFDNLEIEVWHERSFMNFRVSASPIS